MPVTIVAPLTAAPRPVSTPGVITFTQLVQTTRPHENVIVEYFVDPNHDFWFVPAPGEPPVHYLRFVERISGGGTQLRHQAGLVTPHGNPLGMFPVRQMITDSQGQRYRDACQIVIA